MLKLDFSFLYFLLIYKKKFFLVSYFVKDENDRVSWNGFCCRVVINFVKKRIYDFLINENNYLIIYLIIVLLVVIIVEYM